METIDGGAGDDVIEGGLERRHAHGRAGARPDPRRLQPEHVQLPRLPLPVRQRHDQRPRRREGLDRLRRGRGQGDRRRDRRRRAAASRSTRPAPAGPRPRSRPGRLRRHAQRPVEVHAQGAQAGHRRHPRLRRKRVADAHAHGRRADARKKLGTKKIAARKASGSGTVTVTAKLTKKARKRLGRLRSGKARSRSSPPRAARRKRFAKVVKLKRKASRARASSARSQRGGVEARVLLGQEALGGPAAAERAQAALAVLGGEVGERAEPPGARRGRRARSRPARCASSASASSSIPATGWTERDGERPARASPSERSAARRSRTARCGDRAEVGLGHDEHVGDLHDPGLEELEHVAGARLDDDRDGVGGLGDLGLGLADADRLDDDDVEGRRERLRGGARGGREAAEPLARRHRADEERRGRPGRRRSARGRRAARRPSASRTGRRRAPPTVRPRARQARASALSSVDLPAPGRPGDADDVPGRLAAEPRRARPRRAARRSPPAARARGSRAG